MDDFVLLDDDPGRLRAARDAIREHLARYRLRLHPRKAEVSRIADGADLLGFRVLPQRVAVRKANVHAAKRRLRAAARAFAERRLDVPGLTARVRSWLAHGAHASGARVRAKVLAAGGLLAACAFPRKRVPVASRRGRPLAVLASTEGRHA